MNQFVDTMMRKNPNSEKTREFERDDSGIIFLYMELRVQSLRLRGYALNFMVQGLLFRVCEVSE